MTETHEVMQLEDRYQLKAVTLGYDNQALVSIESDKTHFLRLLFFWFMANPRDCRRVTSLGIVLIL